MKRKSVYLVLFVFIILSLSTYFYLNSSYQKIDVFTANGFDKETNTPISSITDKKTMREISIIIKTSNKINGKVDVAPPNFVLEIHSFINGIKTIYLWLDKDSIKGMLMYKNKNGTGYSISEDNTQRLKQVILISKN